MKTQLFKGILLTSLILTNVQIYGGTSSPQTDQTETPNELKTLIQDIEEGNEEDENLSIKALLKDIEEGYDSKELDEAAAKLKVKKEPIVLEELTFQNWETHPLIVEVDDMVDYMRTKTNSNAFGKYRYKDYRETPCSSPGCPYRGYQEAVQYKNLGEIKAEG